MNNALYQNTLAKTLLRVIAGLTFSFFSTAVASESSNQQAISELNFAAADWCPYSCDNENAPGFVTEAMTEALTKQGIRLSVTILPWTRAIKMAEQGDFDGLLTVAQDEVSGFHLTEIPSGQFQDCLFTLPKTSFTFRNRDSFKGLTLGAIQDYSYGAPLDEIIKTPLADEQVYLLSSSNPLLSLIEMTYKKRIDTFVEDRFVVAKYLKDTNSRPLKNSGCLAENDFFTAISPSYGKHQEAVTLLNRLLASQEYKQQYRAAQKRYGGR